jgi:8-oxo-dGTP pyrophosphatase MutT (NUDIX family)
MKKFTGAGILFTALDADGLRHVLLARRKSGVWSISGGKASIRDADHQETAWRETEEEFGVPLDRGTFLFEQRYPFGLGGFDWTTLVHQLPVITDPSVFPNPHARDFHREFTEARWFPISQTPPKTHILLLPILLRLRKG